MHAGVSRLRRRALCGSITSACFCPAVPRGAVQQFWNRRRGRPRQLATTCSLPAAVSCRSWPLVQLASPTNPARASAHHPHDACATMADRTRAAVRQDPLQWRARRAGPLCKRSTVGAQHWLGADDGPSRGVDVAPHLPVGLGSSLRPSACGARRPSTTSAALRVSQRRSPPPASQRLLHTRFF